MKNEIIELEIVKYNYKNLHLKTFLKSLLFIIRYQL